MKVCLGLDLRPSSLGSLHFARWLSDQGDGANSGGHAAFVLEPRLVDALAQASDLLELRSQAELTLQHIATHDGFGAIAAPVEIRHGADADVELAAFAEEHHADVLIIGRAAATEDRRWVRLGRVARRLLRRLPRTVIVVPPELRAESIGTGPVLLATSLLDDSDAAALFARSLAEAIDRPIVVMHVAAAIEPNAQFHVPATVVARMERDAVTDAKRELDVWMGNHALAHCNAIVALGSPAERIVDVARAEHCATIVCGSRVLGLAPRVFGSSVGTAVAATAGCPTAVVPPRTTS